MFFLTTRFLCCRESGLAAREQQVQQQANKHGQLEQLLSALWQRLQELPGNATQVCLQEGDMHVL
jgi:hypothetical protein